MGQKGQSWKQLKKISSKNLLNALREKIQSFSHSVRSESEDGSEEEDCVLAENGISASEEEEESTEDEDMIESTENFNVNTTIVYTRSVRRATRIQI